MIIQMYGLIFNADLSKGGRFLSLEQIIKEREQLQKDTEHIKSKLE